MSSITVAVDTVFFRGYYWGMPDTVNAGVKRLRELVGTERGGITALAAKLGVDHSLVSRWVAGERLPDTRNRALLEDLLEISWREWDAESEAEA